MGPLAGVRVVEFAGLGPGPFCAMLLADLGAEVIRIERKSASSGDSPMEKLSGGPLNRGRRSVAIDLKHPEGPGVVLRLLERADALIEGFRPGVMERLGLGPEVCLGRNPRLVYGRMTGWGQEGPLAQAAGHDINYISVSGALHAIGPAGGAPTVPLNLVGDFGGGGMLLALGVVSALLEAGRSGRGQVVDAAMTDGAALLLTMIRGLQDMGQWPGGRGENLLDGGAFFYGVYECADGRHVAAGPIEPQFCQAFLRVLELDPADFPQWDRGQWPRLREKIAAALRTRTRDEWCARAEGLDACLTPVLSMEEAPSHPQNRDRGAFFEGDGFVQASPAPRFSRTPAARPGPIPQPGQHTHEALASWGFSPEELAALSTRGAI